MNEFRNLVFEGGGVKGIAYGGALTELEKMGILKKIIRVAGTSAGAITAVLLAVGYSAKEISDIVAQTSFNDFADTYNKSDKLGYVFDVFNLIMFYGWHKGDVFEQWIGRLVDKKTKNRDITFAELVKKGRALYVVGTDLSSQQHVVYSHETTPDFSVVKATRISMSLPLYFKSVNVDGKTMVDGGITKNYPLNLFDDKKYLDSEKNGEDKDYNRSVDYAFNHETLGFRLDSKDEILFNERQWSNTPTRINNILDYTKSLLFYMMESANKSHLHADDWNRTVFIDTVGVGTTDFELPQNKIDELVESGKQGVISHFKWRNGKKGMKKP